MAVRGFSPLEVSVKPFMLLAGQIASPEELLTDRQIVRLGRRL